MWMNGTEVKPATVARFGTILFASALCLACGPWTSRVVTVGHEAVTVQEAQAHFGSSTLPANEADYSDLVARERVVLAYPHLDKEKTVRNRLASLREDALVESFVLSRHPAALECSQDDLFAYYRARHEERHVRHILCADEETASRAANSLKNGLPFEEAAQKWSKDENSREKGGDLGWIRRGQTEPAFEAAVFAMKTGEVSPPVRTGYGLHLIQLLDQREASRQDFLAAEEPTRSAWRRERQEALKRMEFERLRRSIAISKNLESLQASTPDVVERPGDEKVVAATIGDSERLTLADLKAFMRRTFPSGQSSHTLGPSTKERFLDLLIERRILVAAAKDAGTERGDLFRAVYWERSHALLASLARDAYLSGWKVPEEELRSYYEDHKSEIAGNPERRLAILVGNEPSGLSKMADALRERPDRFEESARRFSLDSETAFSGGDIGWVDGATLEKLLPANEARALMKAGKNTILGPIQTSLGTLLVKVTEVREGPPFPFDAVRTECEEAYKREFRENILAKWEKALEKRFPARFHLHRLR